MSMTDYRAQIERIRAELARQQAHQQVAERQAAEAWAGVLAALSLAPTATPADVQRALAACRADVARHEQAVRDALAEADSILAAGRPA